MPDKLPDKFYTQDFFREQIRSSFSSAKVVVPIIMELIKPNSVVDVGCGVGTWPSVFRKKGIKDILGIDGDYIDRQMLKIPKKHFLPFDLTKPIRLDRKFDLAISLEVAEHLPKRCAKTFVDSLANLAPVILFSAAIPYQGGTNHTNEQWPQYWEKFFNRKGYLAIDCLRVKLWNNPKVEIAYAQNMLVYVQKERLKDYPLLAQEFPETKSLPLSIVHPQIYQHIVNRYQRSIKLLLKRLFWEIGERLGLIKMCEVGPRKRS